MSSTSLPMFSKWSRIPLQDLGRSATSFIERQLFHFKTFCKIFLDLCLCHFSTKFILCSEAFYGLWSLFETCWEKFSLFCIRQYSAAFTAMFFIRIFWRSFQQKFSVSYSKYYEGIARTRVFPTCVDKKTSSLLFTLLF